MPTTAAELDLTLIPGKQYFHVDACGSISRCGVAGVGPVVRKTGNGTAFVKLDLAAHQFVILA